MIEDIVRLTRRQAVPIDRLCDRLMLSRKVLRALVSEAKGEGYRIRIVDGFVSTSVAVGPTSLVKLGSTKPGRYQTVQITDTHFGSRHCHEDGILDVITRAWDRGVRVGFSTGDVLDGCGPKLLADQDFIGWDHQATRAVRVFKKAPPIKWVAIDGNHDGYFSAAMGTVSGRHLETEMRAAGVDWTFAGVCQGRAVLHGARFYLWHPHGGASTRNSIRRILNEKIEALDEPCDVVAIGHFHKHATVNAFPEGVFGLAGGTFQLKKSEFANRISRPWDTGGVVISHTLTRDGVACEFSSRFLPVVRGV